MYILEHKSHKRALEMRIVNEKGNIVYSIKDKYALFSKTSYVRDANGKELAEVQQVAGITPVSKVSFHNGKMFQVVQAFSMRPKFIVKGCDYTIEGRIFDTNYFIAKGREKILQCRKEMLQGKKVYVMEVLQKQYELEAIAIVVAIEAAKRNLFSSQISN